MLGWIRLIWLRCVGGLLCGSFGSYRGQIIIHFLRDLYLLSHFFWECELAVVLSAGEVLGCARVGLSDAFFFC